MNTLFMKIHSYEESSGSLVVSFASDETRSQNPEDYPAYAFQPLHMWPDVTDINEIKKRIAVAGMYHAEQQVREEVFKVDEARIAELRNSAGQLRSYMISDLASPVPPSLESTETIPSVEV